MSEITVPKFLEEKLIAEYGEELYSKIKDGYTQKRLTTLRCNTIKSNNEEIINYFNSNNIKYELGPIDNSFILLNKTANDLYDTDLVKNGLIYMQSISSMMPPLYLDAKENDDILDMAAAPGGKTTLISALTNDKARITAVEKDKIRSERLKYNLKTQGIKNVFVMNQDAKNLDDYFTFNKILLDAPCSGSGTLYIGEGARPLKISDELVKNSAKIQLTLLKKALKIVKKGGVVIYSTCSILKEENEDVLNKALQGSGCKIVPIETNAPTLPSKIDGVITVMPDCLHEGFFVAKITKN